MTSPNPLPTVPLKHNVLYDLGGRKYTLNQLREQAIDSELYHQTKDELTE